MKKLSMFKLVLLTGAINACTPAQETSVVDPNSQDNQSTVTLTQTQTQTQTESETTTESETQTATQSMTQSETQTATDSETQTATQTMTQSETQTETDSETATQTEVVFTVPALIEAEDFTAYSDTESLNKGGEYRSDEGVDIQESEDDNLGYNIAWTAAGEWLEYDINVEQTGEFDLLLRLAAKDSGKNVSVSINDVEIGQVAAPSDGWQVWDERGIYGVFLMSGTHTVKVTFLDGDTNFNWINIQEAVEIPPSCSDGILNQGEEGTDCGDVCNTMCRNATAIGGDGVTVAGAVDVSCDTPEGFSVVTTLEDMISAMNSDNVNVALAPGAYFVDEDDTGLFATQALPREGFTASTLFSMNGENSHYDFRCTTIEFDTDLWREFGGNEVIQIRTVGNFNTLSNMTIEDIGDTSPKGGALGIVMDGSDNTIQGLVMTSRGAQPYGLGDAYGKGGGPVLSHQKHSSALIRGLRSTLRNSTIYNYSYGHTIFMQASDDTLIDGVYVQGELRSTADMLAANNPRFALADARAASVNFTTVWGYVLPTGYWMSLQEAGIRAYNAGNTEIDGVAYSRGANDVTVLNSVIKNTRTGVTLVHATGTRYIENTTSIGTEQGFSIGSGNIVNSYADAQVGPVITFAYSSDSGTTADITVLPSDGSQNGWGALAYIGGRNHNITLRSEEGTVSSDLEIVVSGDKHSIRHLEDALQNQDQLTLTNTVINNLTPYPMLVNDLATGVTGQSNGPILENVNDNDIDQN